MPDFVGTIDLKLVTESLTRIALEKNHCKILPFPQKGPIFTTKMAGQDLESSRVYRLSPNFVSFFPTGSDPS